MNDAIADSSGINVVSYTGIVFLEIESQSDHFLTRNMPDAPQKFENAVKGVEMAYFIAQPVRYCDKLHS